MAAPAAADDAAPHADPLIPVLFNVVLVVAAGRIGGDLAIRLGQPEVLGELLAGVVLGNVRHLGFAGFAHLGHDPILEALAGLGVVLLLFNVGLESTVGDMLRVGPSSLTVAVLGVVAPSIGGYLVGRWLLPDASLYTHVFLGTALCATSVGITARVLQDLGRSRDREARIILGAAVLDDVLGLLVLAAVSGAVAAAASGKALSLGDVAWLAATAVAFLAAALVLGRSLAPRLLGVASRLRSRGTLEASALGICFVLAAIAGKIGLAPIVGAFAAGLLLEGVHFRRFGDRALHQLEEGLRPIVTWLAPLFFVRMGSQVDLASFGRFEVLGLAVALTVVAIAGKQVCALGVLERGLNRLAVGIGMVPRGEVGLIFAEIGRKLRIGEAPVIDDGVFSAVVIMVIVTTVATPPLLAAALRRQPAGPGPPAPS